MGRQVTNSAVRKGMLDRSRRNNGRMRSTAKGAAPTAASGDHSGMSRRKAAAGEARPPSRAQARNSAAKAQPASA